MRVGGMSIPEIDRLTEVVVLLKRKRPVTYEDIEWMIEEIVRLRELLAGKQESTTVTPAELE